MPGPEPISDHVKWFIYIWIRLRATRTICHPPSQLYALGFPWRISPISTHTYLEYIDTHIVYTSAMQPQLRWHRLYSPSNENNKSNALTIMNYNALSHQVLNTMTTITKRTHLYAQHWSNSMIFWFIPEDWSCESINVSALFSVQKNRWQNIIRSNVGPDIGRHAGSLNYN